MRKLFFKRLTNFAKTNNFLLLWMPWKFFAEFVNSGGLILLNLIFVRALFVDWLDCNMFRGFFSFLFWRMLFLNHHCIVIVTCLANNYLILSRIGTIFDYGWVDIYRCDNTLNLSFLSARLRKTSWCS